MCVGGCGFKVRVLILVAIVFGKLGTVGCTMSLWHLHKKVIVPVCDHIIIGVALFAQDNLSLHREPWSNASVLNCCTFHFTTYSTPHKSPTLCPSN